MLFGSYLPVVIFIMPYKVFLIFESVDEILSVVIQMKVTKQYRFMFMLFVQESQF